MFKYLLVPQLLLAICRNLAHTSIKADCPSGKVPTTLARRLISLFTLKDVKSTSWQGSYDFLKDLLRSEYMRHQELATSQSISAADFYQKVVKNQAKESDYMLALNKLSQMLHENYNVPPIIIIDEYDTPIQQGYLHGYYDEVVAFMRNLLSGGLKDNKHL